MTLIEIYTHYPHFMKPLLRLRRSVKIDLTKKISFR